MTPTVHPYGTEGPRPVQHRCRTCLGAVETYTPTGTRMLRAKRHADIRYVIPCAGSYGPVDADAELLDASSPYLSDVMDTWAKRQGQQS